MPADPIGMFLAVGERATNNLKATFSELSLTKFIRLVAVVGAYVLLRPYLLKLAGKRQLEQQVAAEQEAEAEAEAQGKRITASDIRGQRVAIPDESSDEGEDGVGSATGGPDWGRNARRRQRKMVKKLLDAHEQKLAQEQEDEEDKDIEEFLIKD